MKRRPVVFAALVASSLVAGTACRDMPATVVNDLAHGGNLDLAVTPTDDAAPTDDAGTSKGDCTATSAFVQTSIANLRSTLGKSGCYELDNVVLHVPVKPGTAVTLYAQDAAGGDWSALRFDCSTSSSAHKCDPGVHDTLAKLAQGHSVTLKGTYVRKGAVGAIVPEHFYVAAVTDNGPAAMVPAPTMLQQSDVVRGGHLEAKYFQKVTFATTDKLVVYDLAPTELAYNNTNTCAKCPCQFGFGMVPAAAMKPAAPACVTPDGGTAVNPAGLTADPTEIFIGTDYYKTFTVSSDCQCSGSFNDLQVVPGNAIAKGAMISGVLVFDDEFNNQAVQYQYIAPVTVPLTGTGLPAMGDFPLQAM